MEQEKVAALVAENLKTIFAYSLTRLNNREEAEDLAGDIVTEVLKYGHRVKEDDAFYGYMWSIASNTFKKYLRSKKGYRIEFTEDFMGGYFDVGFENAENTQEISALRRELALLSKQYRQAAVLYYVYNRSCAEISTGMNVSVDMVKYYLFKTRQILKEGIGMNRELGEKSYLPGTFRMDYWGNGDNTEFWALFKRKLPGNILLAAYDTPLSLAELSTELGVSVVYLEDEIDILLQYEMLKQMGNGKVQTNIIIFTNNFEKELSIQIKPLCKEMATIVTHKLKLIAPEVRNIDFTGKNYGDNRFLWTLTTLLMWYAHNWADRKQRSIFGEYPLLANGSYGFVYGYDNDYENHHFEGIYGCCPNKAETAQFTVYNYRVITNSQRWKPIKWCEVVEAVNAAILREKASQNEEMVIEMLKEGFIASNEGILSANFPVFTQKQFDQLWELLKPLSEEVGKCILTISGIAGDLLKSHAPKALSGQCGQLAAIKYEMDSLALIVEAMVDSGDLHRSDCGEKLAMYGIIK